MTATPIQTWAAAHASTVSLEADPAQPAPQLPPEPTPVRLISFNEANSWPVYSGEFRLAWAKLDERTVIVTGSNDNETRIRDASTGEVLRTFTGHTDGVYCVAINSTNGQPLLATGSADGTARIWDMSSGLALHNLTEHSYTIGAVAWTTAPEGRLLLATGSSDRTARIWDAATGQPVHTLTGHSALIQSVAWAPPAGTQSLLATGSGDGTARIWDAITGQTLHTLSGHSGPVNSVSWTTGAADQPLLATGSNDQTARIWNASGTDLGILRAPAAKDGDGRIFMLSWAPLRDGRLLLATASSDTLRLWDGLTNSLLHTQNLNFVGAGYKHLDWTISDDGRLLLATISHENPTTLHVWEVVLDPPVVSQPQEPETREPITLESLVDVTPDYPGGSGRRTDYLACSVQPDGDILLAAAGFDQSVQIWSLLTGQSVHELVAPNMSYSVAWEPAGGSRLAVANGDATVGVFDCRTGNNLSTLVGHTSGVRSVAWGRSPAGSLLLATGSEDQTARIWDPETGQTLLVLRGHGDLCYTVAWAPDGSLLATGSKDATVRIWDPYTGNQLHNLTGHTGDVTSVAWATTRDGRLLLATASLDGTVRIWDPELGATLHTLAGRSADEAGPLAWASTRDGRLLLATAGGGTARIWDPLQAVELAAFAGPDGHWHSMDWVLSPDGDLQLVIARDDESPAPARTWRVRVKPSRENPSAALWTANPDRSERRASRVLALGSAGMWRPMGLVEDLVQVTAKDGSTTLNDGRVGALANEPGVRRLRELGWSAGARLAFVPLLTSRLSPQQPFEPPVEESPAALRNALRNAVAKRVGAARPAGVELSELHTAAETITDRIMTLLTILGPRACTVDPLLPTRLLHRAVQLPALNARQLRLMSSGELQREVLERARGTGNHEYNPGTAGLARSGPLNRLLPTQLALPHDLMTMRYLENHLLYRQHRAPAPPTPEVVTLVLDTSPPTFGLVEQVLRLAAHLLVVTLWEYGHQPAVVTLDDPESAVTLARRVDLMRVWTSRTLDDPWPAIKTAVHTASGTGHPVLLLTHHHTPHGGYHTSDRTRLLTAHHPPESPPDGRLHGYHHHLSPNPTRDELADVISGLLAQSRDRT